MKAFRGTGTWNMEGRTSPIKRIEQFVWRYLLTILQIKVDTYSIYRMEPRLSRRKCTEEKK